jgi:hypothetical protein
MLPEELPLLPPPALLLVQCSMMVLARSTWRLAMSMLTRGRG